MKTEAQKLTDTLIGRFGLQAEEVAFRCRVSLNSVMRWRRGTNPQPGHLSSLRDLVEEETRRRERRKAVA